MIDISTKYMGIPLSSPIVASSSPLWSSIDNVKKLEDAGGAAVVLPSLFEEQVNFEQRFLEVNLQKGTEQFAESLTYLPDMGTYTFTTTQYLEHVRRCKQSVNIPVIGNLNGISRSGWLRFAREIQDAGADGLELNIYYLPVDPRMSSEEVESNYTGIVNDIVKTVNIPVSVKLNPYLSAIPYMLKELERAGASAVVLFNRFYEPDIDLKNLELVPTLKLSTSDELGLRLRWTGLVYNNISVDIAITGGVHTAEDCLKCVASGASAVMMTSVILKKGISYLGEIRDGISEWLDENDYDSIKSFRGVMSRTSSGQTDAYVRANYMKILGSFKSES